MGLDNSILAELLKTSAKPVAAKTTGKRRLKRKVAVIDFETDPFKYGRIPVPFCCEFTTADMSVADFVRDYVRTLNDPTVIHIVNDEVIGIQFWGPDCGDKLVKFVLALEEPFLIYAHNGGKFDFHFILKYIDNPALIIKTRIVECQLGIHTLRDSYAILPVPLRDYEKMEFDYSLMEAPVREKNKSLILEYLHSDCVNLLRMVAAFVERFGPRITIGGTAIKELQKLHPFKKSGERHDEVFRKYYYGGRVQCFQSGLIKGPVTLVDRNSMYPAAMKEKKHPINGRFDWSSEMPDNFDMPFFVTFTGRNTNALPSIANDGSLIFTKTDGLFHATSHELEIALEHNLIEIDEIHECLLSTDAVTFDEFVDLFYSQKSECKRAGDKIGELFAKLLLNSAYGRTGINPRNFADWLIHRDFGNEEQLEADGYTQAADYEDIELWSRDAEVKDEQFCDVAIAASITSAARANLLANLQLSVDPMYCDTDSIICRSFGGDTDKYRLGAWDVEKVADRLAIAGKKMYALYSDVELSAFGNTTRGHTSLICSKCKLPLSTPQKQKDHQLKCNVKLSSKGGSLDLRQIVSICQGETVYYENDAPTFSLKKPPAFVHRNFRITAESDLEVEAPEPPE